MLKKLSELQLGGVARINSLTTVSLAGRQRLFAWGLIPGAEVKVVRIAPLGDPLQIQLNHDIMLSIRKSEAQDIKVECNN